MYPLTVFYDGSCSVCRREMQGYQKNNPYDRLLFIDISQPDFRANRYARTQQELMARMHVRTVDGQYATGVAAFILIWQAYPKNSIYSFGAWLVGLPGFFQVASGCYYLFARYRHLLPRKRNCSNTGCHPEQERHNVKGK